MEGNGNKTMKFSGLNSFSSRPADQDEEKNNKAQNLSYLTCLSSPVEDERNKLAKTSSILSSFSTYSTVEAQLEKIPNMNAGETEIQETGWLRKDHQSHKHKNMVMQRKENASQKKEDRRQDLEIDIKEMIINSARPPLSSDCCIYRLGEVNKKAYTPRTVSIGPLHHKNKNLKGMQEVKVKYLEQFLERATKTAMLNELPIWADKVVFLNSNDIDLKEGNDFSCLDKFIRILRSSEDKIRKSYADDLNHITSEELLKIILVDSAFIIDLFLRFHFGSSEDTILSTPFVLVSIRMDLWLLENQVPFFVLEELYDEAFGSYPNIYPPFLDLSCTFFANYGDQKVIGEIKHFTDLLRTFLLPIRKDDENSSNGGAPEENYSKRILKIFTDFLRHWGLLSSSARKERSYFKRVVYSEQLKSATQLHAAGVVLNVSSSKSCLLDISFSNPKLEIPCLDLYDDTEALFRNVMALEQHHYPLQTLISDYVTLMDYLINTSEDAELLVEMKIIKNRLGSNQQVASLFNRLCRNILKGSINQRFSCLIDDLNAYYDIPWNTWKATFWRRYFSTPWKTASTIAAFILLVLTLVQTILTAVAL